jgi:hypothetical protein
VYNLSEEKSKKIISHYETVIVKLREEFFDGNGCFDILTVHFFINIKEKYLPDT